MRVFAGVLIVVFVIGCIVVTAALPNLYLAANRASRTSITAVADACAAELSRLEPGDLAGNRATLDRLRARYDVASITMTSPGNPELRSGSRPLAGERVEHRTAGIRAVEVRFRPDPMPRVYRMLRIAAGAGIVASFAGIALLSISLFGAFSSANPSPERRTSHALRPQSSGLMETFQTSIQAMKGREVELRRLHDQEKERANELATVTGTLVRSLTSGFLAVDADDLVVDMNQAAREIAGVTASVPVAGQSVAAVLGESSFSRVLQSAIAQRETLQREEISGEGNELHVIGLTTVPLLDDSGRYFGMLALFTDLTPSRRLETQVREMQALADLGELSAGIAHEFRNSLSTVLGYLSLARKSSAPDEAAERIARAEEEARQLARAVESLLRFARPMTLQPQRIGILELMRDVVDSLRGAAGSTEIEIRGPELIVDGDADLLRRAFENVVRNAIDAVGATGRRGSIVIESTGGPVARLTVTDNGVGVEPAQIPRLFLPFQSTKASGFGLGLALSKKIVLSHRGTIRLAPRAAGEGVTVTIELPRS
jgi:signal transduction histidine kinase